MALDFPDAPVDGDIYTSGSVSYQFDGVDGVWRAMAAPSGPATIGDFKHGFQTGDHGGWIKLNGRAVTTLLPGQQVEAAAFGWTANLPDATSCFLVQSSSTAPGAISGNSAKTIALANLPVHNLNISGVDTDSQGNHSHEVIVKDGGDENFFDFQTKSDHAFAAYASINTEGGTKLASIKQNNATGAHAHNLTGTLPLGGSGTAIDVTPKHLSANAFCYLGTV